MKLRMKDAPDRPTPRVRKAELTRITGKEAAWEAARTLRGARSASWIASLPGRKIATTSSAPGHIYQRSEADTRLANPS